MPYIDAVSRVLYPGSIYLSLDWLLLEAWSGVISLQWQFLYALEKGAKYAPHVAWPGTSTVFI